MHSIVTVYVTFPGQEEAAAVLKQLLSEGIVACGNILSPCISMYQWAGVLREDLEVPVLLKVTEELAESVCFRVRELHSYENPCVVVWPIVGGSEEYAMWVRQSMRMDG
ncbi:divalent-cation tolerance protein CutA [Planctomicrobium sp. SH668]|uniref:divalent-cation tolerance protein CutA n=1 Tax=Planctomicrobium sp. SH668 TaxID=3448126 RepID=UPI003F5AF308